MWDKTYKTWCSRDVFVPLLISWPLSFIFQALKWVSCLSPFDPLLKEKLYLMIRIKWVQWNMTDTNKLNGLNKSCCHSLKLKSHCSCFRVEWSHPVMKTSSQTDVCLLAALTADHKLLPCSSCVTFYQLFLEDSCQNMESDNRGTEAAASWHLQPLMEIQCEEEEESLCHCWLVTASPAGSSWSWLMELSAGLAGGREGLFFSPFTEAPVYLPTTDGPPGAPGSFAPPLPYALSILHLNQRTGSWAQPPDLQVTSATGPPSQS